ncbi:MAG: hypothetical protein COC09_02015 [Gammaproteobacteria bacterium]|nr:DUF3426 domain-containing protein [Gammaproteobacteria bacterium]PCH64546.1 MAG: hypothetical protein COC09_02015 [Gammaproteobacteria bacterium]
MTEPEKPKRRIEDALGDHTLHPKGTLHHHSQLPLPRRSFWWTAITVVLIGFLIIQLSFTFQQQLRAYPAAEPWLSLLCQWLPCENTEDDPYQALRIISREVIAHPATANAIQVNATIINQHSQVLAFPVLGLSFKNIDGQVIASRQFGPEEYLADDLDHNIGLPSHELIRISLDLVDPGNSAVAFEFQFSPAQ